MRLDRIKMISTMARQGMTVQKLAERAGVSYSSISAVRRGTSVREDTAKKLAAALGVNLEDLKEATS